MKIRFTGGLATASVPAATRIEKPSVDCDIDDYDHTRERKLDLAGKTRRIDDCQQIVLETHDFQAPGFYQKLGFEAVNGVDDYPRGHRYLTLIKRLA